MWAPPFSSGEERGVEPGETSALAIGSHWPRFVRTFDKVYHVPVTLDLSEPGMLPPRLRRPPPQVYAAAYRVLGGRPIRAGRRAGRVPATLAPPGGRSTPSRGDLGHLPAAHGPLARARSVARRARSAAAPRTASSSSVTPAARSALRPDWRGVRRSRGSRPRCGPEALQEAARGAAREALSWPTGAAWPPTRFRVERRSRWAPPRGRIRLGISHGCETVPPSPRSDPTVWKGSRLKPFGPPL